jgi:hypothetical protein
MQSDTCQSHPNNRGTEDETARVTSPSTQAPTRAAAFSPARRAPSSSFIKSARDPLIVILGFVVIGQAFGADASGAPQPSAQTQAALIWIWGAVGAAVGANALFSFWRNITQGLKVEPNPASTYQPIQVCRQMHTELAAKYSTFEQEMRAMLLAHDRKAEDRASGSHKRIDALVQVVFSQQGTIDNHIAHHPGVK